MNMFCPKVLRSTVLQLWNSHHMFSSSKDVETYLGVLDAVFMVSYAVVSERFILYIIIRMYVL